MKKSSRYALAATSCVLVFGACEDPPTVEVDAGGCPDEGNIACKNGMIYDPATCSCITDPCPPVGIACGNGKIFDHATCSCIIDPCPTEGIVCKNGGIIDKVTCTCREP